jgi:hypothetical protein
LVESDLGQGRAAATTYSWARRPASIAEALGPLLASDDEEEKAREGGLEMLLKSKTGRTVLGADWVPGRSDMVESIPAGTPLEEDELLDLAVELALLAKILDIVR